MNYKNWNNNINYYMEGIKNGKCKFNEIIDTDYVTAMSIMNKIIVMNYNHSTLVKIISRGNLEHVLKYLEICNKKIDMNLLQLIMEYDPKNIYGDSMRLDNIMQWVQYIETDVIIWVITNNIPLSFSRYLLNDKFYELLALHQYYEILAIILKYCIACSDIEHIIQIFKLVEFHTIFPHIIKLYGVSENEWYAYINFIELVGGISKYMDHHNIFGCHFNDHNDFVNKVISKLDKQCSTDYIHLLVFIVYSK